MGGHRPQHLSTSVGLALELLEPPYYEERRSMLLRLIKLAFIRKERSRRYGARRGPWGSFSSMGDAIEILSGKQIMHCPREFFGGFL